MAILFESEWEWTLKLRFNQPQTYAMENKKMHSAIFVWQSYHIIFSFPCLDRQHIMVLFS